jgi:hypothetical protein
MSLEPRGCCKKCNTLSQGNPPQTYCAHQVAFMNHTSGTPVLKAILFTLRKRNISYQIDPLSFIYQQSKNNNNNILCGGHKPG